MYTLAISLLAFFSAPLTHAAAVPAKAAPGSCTPGLKATPNALYSTYCQSAPKNITDALSFSQQPSFSACLTACDNNPKCQFTNFYEYPNPTGWCVHFADFIEPSSFTTPGQYWAGYPNTGAIAM